MKRVFRIDQECYVIFLEDFSNSKDRFLRIGNSSFFKDFNNKLIFVDLVSKLLPGDPKLELELFNPDIDKEVIGLKDILINYLTFLKKNGIDIDNVKKISAQDKSRRVTVQKSEKDFLKEIKKNKKYDDYSFASFYKDGNVRIFNQNEEIFDLKNSQNISFDEYKELIQGSNFYKQYKESYKKNGFIHSNESLFLFSKNNFACFTKSANWVKDAIRVGINPFEVKIVYLAGDNTLNSYFYKIILSHFDNKSKINLIFRKKEFAIEYRFSKEFYIPFYTTANSEQKEITLNDFTIKFSNDKVLLSYNNLIFNLNYNDNYLQTGYIIDGKFINKNNSENFKIVLEEFKKNHFTIYSTNPVVLNDGFTEDNYISSFWKNFPDKTKKDFVNEIHDKDSGYNNYEISLKTNNFYEKLFIETVRRTSIEGRNNIQDEKLNQYADFLTDFSGNEINKNNIIIEQNFGILSINQKSAFKDFILSKNLPYIDDKANPFLTFEKELTTQEWVEKQQTYRDNHKKNIHDQELSRIIDNRFANTIKNKKFYSEEQERLLRFMNKVITEKKRNNEEIDHIQQKSDTSTQETKLNDNKTIQDNLSKDYINNKTKENKNKSAINLTKFLFPSLAALLLIGLIILAILFGPKLFNNFYIAFLNNNHKIQKDNTTDISQDDYLKNAKNKYDNKTDANKTSTHYKFYMTNLDLLNLTNLVAERNNYHRIVFDYQKRYTKGKDPDWIFPGIVLVMPDSTKITVKYNDTMWDICDNYLIDEINNQEVKIRSLIEQTKLNKILITDAQKEFLVIKSQSHSQMMKDFLDELIKQKSFDKWEPYIDEIKERKERKQ